MKNKLTKNLFVMHHLCRKVTIMTTLVERNSRKPLRRHESLLHPSNKKAKLGHRNVTDQPTLELCTPYKLLDLVYRTLKIPSGSLVQVSMTVGEGKKAVVFIQHLIVNRLTSEMGRMCGMVNHNITISGYDHNELVKLRKEDQIVLPTTFFDINIAKEGAPADNNNITYEIAVLATDYFERLKTAEASLPPILPPPLCQLVRAYIS